MSDDGKPHYTPAQKARVKANLAWFKTTFGGETSAALRGTPFTLDLLTAIAMQETGYIWGRTRLLGRSVADVLMLCVGDPLDKVNGRDAKAFPADRADLEAAPKGREMFAIARQSLLDLAAAVPVDHKWTDNPDKFCHGYGIFQNDIQAFKTPSRRSFFLEKKWGTFSVCLSRVVRELTEKKEQLYPDRRTLTRDELIFVAIAYNHGADRTDIHGTFDQGHYNKGDKIFYGRYIESYLELIAEGDLVA